jgi:hypothetical protein
MELYTQFMNNIYSTQVYLDVHYFDNDVNIVLGISNNGAWSKTERLRITWLNTNNPCIEEFNFDNYIQPDGEVEYYNNINCYDINDITEMLLKAVDVMTDEQLDILIKHNIHLDLLIHTKNPSLFLNK